MGKIKQTLTFKRLAKFFKGLPSPLVGELMTALFDMWEKNNGDEPFELDYEIIDEQLQEIGSYIMDGLLYDQIIKKLIKRDKVFGATWKKVNESVIKHIPLDKRDNFFLLLIDHVPMYLPTKGPISYVTKKKSVKLKEDESKREWKGSLKDAAIEVRRIYSEDLKQPIRNYKDLKDATFEYFENTNFVKYNPGRLSKQKFYDLVKKSK